jgi:hypothetical protein
VGVRTFVVVLVVVLEDFRVIWSPKCGQ